jgi:hypothetical protein
MFNQSLTGFASPEQTENLTDEKVAVLKELGEIYTHLKHFPGKHNQEDHAWNAGLVRSDKKKRPSKSGGSGRPSRSEKKSNGISSPFEASRAAANQARTLGVKNVVGLTRAVTSATTALRAWSDKFRTAISMGDENLKKQVVDGFKDLSQFLTKLNESLKNDSVAQSTFQAIVQSFQETIQAISPETKKVFADYPLYKSNTPDAKIASAVGQEIDKNAESKK